MLVGFLLLVCPCAGAQETDMAAADADPAIAAIRFYQQYLSTLRHGHCRFTPSCSEYAAQAITRYGVVDGSARAADRLMRCNASATGSYPRGSDGRLEDPVDEGIGTGAVRVPSWLLVSPEPLRPPPTAALEPGRRDRIEETVDFALRLEQRGDCERAATEYQRAGSLAGSPATESWAFARIGECHFAASQWSFAERAFLTSGMLAPAPAGRQRAVYRAAVSRFDAGAFAACERLLADPALERPSGDSVGAAGIEPVTDTTALALAVSLHRVAALGGLCAMARGDWSRASDEFSRATALAQDDRDGNRIQRLAPFAAQGPALPRRSPGLAGTMSAVIPGSGQAYCGRGQDAFRHLLFNGILIWTVVSLVRNDHVPAAVLTAGIALPFYLGNIRGAQRAARQYDRGQRLDLLQRAIRESAR